MSLGRNQVTLVGMLGDNVNITQFENGGMVARFRLDVKQDDDSVAKKSRLPIYSMFAWGRTASFVHQYCTKGSKLAVSGRLVYRTIVNKKGEPQRITEIEVREVIRF
ncbi:MAG: single-stranded DNA-binding protein [Fluviicola sp.]|jgi:single-strand DNA-binding protein